MVISAGTRLGPYQIVAPIGAGGMGEVWRATDTRLDRSVAIKVLPAEFAHDAQLKMRFEREAKTISQLSHPHICTLHDVGTENGVEYLVMELLDGETLADRVARGPLPIAETLRIGAQIAAALDCAHRAGVAHRDLKPGNIMLTKSGAKLLDFGLAKAGLFSAAPADLTAQKPLTQEGTILGTFQYMAPEQLEGLEADGRTDIFALGAVLYEMATGKRAFQGSTKTSLIAAIVGGEPQPIGAIQPLTPPAFEHVVDKCLAKDREARWQSAYDVAEELRWIGEAGSKAGIAVPAVERKRRRTREMWLATLVAIGVLASAAGWLASTRWTRLHTREPLYRLTIATPPGSVLGFGAGPMALSPDGRAVAYASASSDGIVLLVRKLSETTWRTLDGTSGAHAPFWSPDGKQIAFSARGSLWKIAADGSAPPDQIARIPTTASGTWSPNGTIVFSLARKLYRVGASGGDPVELRLFPADASLSEPSFLPDGRHFLCGVSRRDTAEVEHFVASLDPKEAPKRIVRGDNNATFADGSLFFVRGGTLYAQRFDVDKLATAGDAKAIARVQAFDPGEAAYFSVEGDALVYLPEGSEVKTELQRVDRSGRSLATVGQRAFYFSPRLSRDATRVAVDESATDGSGDIWILSVANSASTRFTFSPENESSPLWGPGDTEMIYFFSDFTGATVMQKRVAGGQSAKVYKDGPLTFPCDWSADGKWFLAMVGERGDRSFAFKLLSPPAWKVVASPGFGNAARFSPDGRWLAYSAIEGGGSPAAQIFVQPLPPNGSKWQVSVDGGSMPVWSRDGKSIFFISPGGKMTECVVSTARDGSFAAQAPQALFGVAVREGADIFAQYDVFPDGTFLVNRIPDTATTPMTVVLHWKEALGQ